MLLSQLLHSYIAWGMGWPLGWYENLWSAKRPSSLLEQLGVGVKSDLIKDEISVAMSQIVKQTVNVRSGNGFGESIIFMVDDRCAQNTNASWRSLDFRVPLEGLRVIPRSR